MSEKPEPIEVEIKPLDRDHGRGAFRCGETRIDNFFKNNSRKDHDAYKVRVFAAFKPGSKEAIGFYSLVLTALVPSDVSEEAHDKFNRVQAVPAIYLAMIGVTEECAKRSIGKQLMRDAFARALAIAENAGAYALALDALNEKVAEYYESLGFERFSEGELKMFITLREIRKSTQPAAA